MIDLHLHTTASDGALAPADLVVRAAAAGLTTISVTDHDTTAGLEEAASAAAARGMTLVPGIEITAVEEERDVHVLGYFIDPASAGLQEFLARQRADRLRRVSEMCARLRDLGLPVDESALPAGREGYSVGRPAIADALVAAGHARDRDDAFARLLGRGLPAFVPRRGMPVVDVVRVVTAAGGVASLAHPILSAIDHAIPAFAARGLAALEARHPDHPPPVEARYREMAAGLGLAVSGGSDYHGDASRNARALGGVTLGADDFAALAARARAAR